MGGITADPLTVKVCINALACVLVEPGEAIANATTTIIKTGYSTPISI